MTFAWWRHGLEDARQGKGRLKPVSIFFVVVGSDFAFDSVSHRYTMVAHYDEMPNKKPRVDRDIVSSLLSLRTHAPLPSLATTVHRLPALRPQPPSLHKPLLVQLQERQKGPMPLPSPSDVRALQADPRVRQAIERLKEHQKTHRTDLSLLSRETVAIIESLAASDPVADDDGSASVSSSASSSRVQSTDGSTIGDDGSSSGKRRRLNDGRRLRGLGEHTIPLEAPVKTSFATSWAQRKHNFELVQLKRDIERCRKEYLSYLRTRLSRCIATNGERQLNPTDDVLGRRIELRVASMAYLFQSRVMYPCGVGAFADTHALTHNAFDRSIRDVAALFRAAAACVRIDHSTIEQCRPMNDHTIAFHTVFWVTITDATKLPALLRDDVRGLCGHFEARGQLRLQAVLTCAYKTFDITEIDIRIDVADALESYKPPTTRDDAGSMHAKLLLQHQVGANRTPAIDTTRPPALRPMPRVVMVPFQVLP
ncbi:hypothetical protein SDRG_06626 [Saprolegnia diclina VS20]|uniref:Uncharacterized protein n=1 Tax=Saprolegnia diclina (strain VS20) TaxID=1156394 RepID=T0QMD3_SAPDV|nr:hypothetical protein SDRG_06626 [Saprolegnia diclina VS20]EQC35876.1 hypothetical protein SDRG_06626 [Saprolegnia diclina VS20]|eukprot:XP_008610638.1 hypothetical protein SDRG_06626 [Saprolegnia diclina VS20]